MLQYAYCFVAELRLRIYDQLLLRRGARLVVKAARSGVNPATPGIKSVLYNHNLPHLDEMTRSAHDQYLDEAFERREYLCDHKIHDRHLENPSAPPFRCPSCRASLHHARLYSTRQITIERDLPSAAILATCRTIATEATSILYCKNTIEIVLGSSPVGRRCNPSERDIRPLCENIFNLNPDKWSTNVALSFRASVFVAFLNTIGPVNAKGITSLSFASSDTDNIANRIPTITSLVELYLPNLQQLKIRVTGRDMDPSICCLECDHPNPASPWHAFWLYGGFTPLRKRLEDFIRRITWLKDLKYEGQMVVMYPYTHDPGGYRELKALEVVVKRRTQGGK